MTRPLFLDIRVRSATTREAVKRFGRSRRNSRLAASKVLKTGFCGSAVVMGSTLKNTDRQRAVAPEGCQVPGTLENASSQA